MKTQSSNFEQLCFSIGRPLAILLEEVQQSSHNPQLIEAAAQMLEGLQAFQQANETGLSKSNKTSTAIYEILTK
ncbi:hypothetical protein [Nostoc sp. FACHB-280]|uniref:hypothetical protein n=1 Tax=Nostoc sp. FACHB-280 TaxID=2692839 RepID=UPI00168B3D2D|nr:hypothetical protein [Nostoc sp. FACHB-280]MBD2495080.1 hypothetical protein [Nostoc sp. FACHB-280]